MGRHSGRRRAPRRVPAGVTLAPLLTLALGAVVALLGSAGPGIGGAPSAYAAPVDPTPSRPASTPSRRPTPTATPSPVTTDATTTAGPTGSSSATADPTTSASATSTATSGSGGGGQPSFQSQPSQTPPPAGTGSTGRVTTPTAAAIPGGNGGGNDGGNGGNGGSSGNSGNGNGGSGGGGQPTQVAVGGRKVASPAGDGRSTLDVVAAARATAVPLPPATGSPDGTSSMTSDASDPSSTGTTTSPGPDDPDLADPPADDAIPGSWRIAALAALFVLGLAVALLVAAARPRGGAHRRH